MIYLKEKDRIIKYFVYLETVPPHPFSIVAIRKATSFLTKTTILSNFTLLDNFHLYNKDIQWFGFNLELLGTNVHNIFLLFLLILSFYGHITK